MSARRPDPGQGVFETLLIAAGRIQALEAHLQRLERSVRELYGRPLPAQSRARVIRALTVQAAATTGERRARIDARPRDGELELDFVTGEVPARRPVALVPVVIPGGLGAHKWRDRTLVDSHGADPTPLIVDRDGEVLEAGWANVWLLEGDELVTPPADGRILPGVTRARLLTLAPTLGLRACERPIGLAQARAAHTLFLTSALRLAVTAGLGAAPPDHPGVDRIRAALLDGGSSPPGEQRR